MCSRFRGRGQHGNGISHGEGKRIKEKGKAGFLAPKKTVTRNDRLRRQRKSDWIPASAGMTEKRSGNKAES
jgi:hypothetical protein